MDVVFDRDLGEGYLLLVEKTELENIVKVTIKSEAESKDNTLLIGSEIHYINYYTKVEFECLKTDFIVNFKSIINQLGVRKMTDFFIRNPDIYKYFKDINKLINDEYIINFSLGPFGGDYKLFKTNKISSISYPISKSSIPKESLDLIYHTRNINVGNKYTITIQNDCIFNNHYQVTIYDIENEDVIYSEQMYIKDFYTNLEIWKKRLLRLSEVSGINNPEWNMVDSGERMYRVPKSYRSDYNKLKQELIPIDYNTEESMGINILSWSYPIFIEENVLYQEYDHFYINGINIGNTDKFMKLFNYKSHYDLEKEDIFIWIYENYKFKTKEYYYNNIGCSGSVNPKIYPINLKDYKNR